jgi:hypothetical protein
MRCERPVCVMEPGALDCEGRKTCGAPLHFHVKTANVTLSITFSHLVRG